MWSRVLQTACVAVKSPISSYFIHLLVSESVSVLPAWMCWPVGVLFVVNVHFRMCECVIFFLPVDVWLFVFSISVSTVTISVFSSPFLPLSSKAPIPLSHLQQPSHSAKTTCFSDFCFFQEWLFFLIALFLFFIIIIIIIVKCIWRKPLCIIL